MLIHADVTNHKLHDPAGGTHAARAGGADASHCAQTLRLPPLEMLRVNATGAEAAVAADAGIRVGGVRVGTTAAPLALPLLPELAGHRAGARSLGP